MIRAAITETAAIDEALVRLASTILPLRHLEPINSDEERQRFRESDRYNPQFRYVPISDEEHGALQAELDHVQTDSSASGQLFAITKDYLQRRLKLRRAVGTDAFWDPDLYGRPPTELLQIAERILNSGRAPDDEPADQQFGANLVVAMMQQALRRYGLTDWQVLARPHVTATNVEAANRRVNVPAEKTYSAMGAKRLVVHEIETHVLRAANGYLQPLKILGAAVIPGYLATEEGLALVNEEREGYIDRSRERVLAARTLASHFARVSSFRDLYTMLRDRGIDADESWTTVKRVKRGLGDTAAPGGYIKDHVYLWGKIKLEQYIVEGGDLALLYIGKVGIDHLEILRHLSLRPPQYLPPSYLR